jgi:UDP-N-acetylmuramyl tripeptide synthase
MSGAAGITLVPETELNPMNATTYGVGEVIRDAIAKGCRHFLVGIGGSATNDGGIGMLQALGFGLLNENGAPSDTGELCIIGERLADGLDLSLWRIDEQTLQNPIQKGKDGVVFTLSLSGHLPLHIDLPIPGSFSIENGALAAMTALSIGVEPDLIKTALAGFSGVKGRMERVGANSLGFSVFLDYAHTPDALEKLLRTVRGFCAENERMILLFGCGGDRDRSKRAEMGRIASRLADLVILTSDNSRTESPEQILCDILKGIDKEKPFRVLPERQKAIEFAIGTARPGDVILLAGKGHEEYEIRGRERLVFCEREIVASCMARRMECEADAD